MKKRVLDTKTQESPFILGVLLESGIFLACVFCIAVGCAAAIAFTNNGFLFPRSALELFLDFLFGLCVLVSAATLRLLIPLKWKSISIVKRIISMLMYVGVTLMLAAFLHGFMMWYRNYSHAMGYDKFTRILSVVFAGFLEYDYYYETRLKRIPKKRAK